MSANHETAMTDIEKDLATDQSGEATRAMVKRFTAVAERVEKHLREPLSREEYRVVDDMRAALRSAVGVLENVWQQLHSNQKLHR